MNRDIVFRCTEPQWYAMKYMFGDIISLEFKMFV